MKFPAYVYELKHEITGKSYVGISHNPRQRLSNHLYGLRHGTHPVEDMQTDYDEYGEHFTFRILEYVPDRSHNRELAWQIELHTLERHRGYNYKDPVTKWWFRPSRSN